MENIENDIYSAKPIIKTEEANHILNSSHHEDEITNQTQSLLDDQSNEVPKPSHIIPLKRVSESAGSVFGGMNSIIREGSASFTSFFKQQPKLESETTSSTTSPTSVVDSTTATSTTTSTSTSTTTSTSTSTTFFSQLTNSNSNSNSKSTQKQTKDTPKQLFGQSLSKLPVMFDIPKVISLSLKHLYQKKAWEKEGIFRNSGNQDNVEKLCQSWNNGKQEIDENEDCHNVTSFLKMFFQFLNNPILTHRSYDDFMNAAVIKEKDEQKKKIIELLNGLPSMNRTVLKRLLYFLSIVNAHSHLTKLTGTQLTQALGPTILSKQSSSAYLEASIMLMRFFLQEFDDLFGVYDYLPYELDFNSIPTIKKNLISIKLTPIPSLLIENHLHLDLKINSETLAKVGEKYEKLETDREEINK